VLVGNSPTLVLLLSGLEEDLPCYECNQLCFPHNFFFFFFLAVLGFEFRASRLLGLLGLLGRYSTT
jgi:hypothetical protein